MKPKSCQHLIITLLYAAFAMAVQAQTNTISYQGRLIDGGAPADGLYDLSFELFNDPSAGSSWGALTNNATTVSNGLFTVQLDFGYGVFDGTDLWLEIGAVTNGGGVLTILSPRQPITSTPYAIKARDADTAAVAGAVSGNVSATQVTGTLSESQLGDNSVTSAKITANTITAADLATDSVGASEIAAGAVGTSEIANGSITTNDLSADVLSNTFWNQDGNAGTTPGTHFLGTTDNQALELKANNSRSMQLAWNSRAYTNIFLQQGTNISVNIIAGSSVNVVSNGVLGASISGGGRDGFLAGSPSVSPNVVLDDFGTIGGGADNVAGSENALLSDASYATVGGGRHNKAAGGFSTVPGGWLNEANGDYSFAAGFLAKANHAGTFVWSDSQSSEFSSSGANQFLIQASGGVGINTTNPATALDVNGTITANAFIGDGSGLTGIPDGSSLDASDGAPSNALVVDAAGKVGIGTPTPASPLHIMTPTNVDCDMRLVSGGSWALILNQSPNSLFTISNGGAERLAIEHGGDVGIGISNPTEKLHVAGNILATGTVTGSSDRNVKEHFASVDPQQILAAVAAMPISTWNYIADDRVRHLGPMAQDFYGAFQIGMDDKHISMVDADGVALAAIQGLNQKLEETRAENAALRKELEEMKLAIETLTQKGAVQ